MTGGIETTRERQRYVPSLISARRLDLTLLVSQDFMTPFPLKAATASLLRKTVSGGECCVDLILLSLYYIN